MGARSATSPVRDPVRAAVPLRRNRRFRVFWSGGLCSMLGVETASVAYPLVILAVTGSPAMAGLFGLVTTLAITVGALPAGDVVDRLDQRRVLLWAEGCRLAAVASVAVAVALGGLGVGHVLVAAAVLGTAQTFGSAARFLIVRAVVSPGQLPAAFAREEVGNGSAQLAGPPLGGFLYGIGPALPFVATIGFLAGSWVCALLVRTRTVAGTAPARPRADQARSGGAIRRAFAGVPVLWRTPSMRGTVLLMVALNVPTAPLPLIAIVVLTDQSVPPATIGLVLASDAAGALVGTLLIRPLCRLLRPGALLLIVGAAELPILWGLTLSLGPYWVMLVLFVCVLPIPALRVTVDTLVFRQAPEEVRGRTIAGVMAVLGLGFGVGVGGAGLLLEHAGVTGALAVLLGVLAATVVYLAADPEMRAMHWPDPEPDREPDVQALPA